MKNKKTIALLIPCLSGGGAEKVAANLSIELTQSGYKVILICTKTTPKEIKYESSGKIVLLNAAEPYYMGRSSILRRLAEYQAMLCTAGRLKKLKRQNHVDVSISFMEYYNFINVLSAGKEKILLRVCTILSERDDMKEWLERNKGALKLLYNHADKVVVMSEYAKKDMTEQYGIRSNKLVKIYNPLRFSPPSEYEGKRFEYGDESIIAVGRIHPIKQYHHMIRAFSGVVKERPNAVLLIIGGIDDKKYYRYLCKLIMELELEGKIFFPGHCKNVNPFYRNAKIFVMTSKTEGFPNVMLEALQEGVPVISADSPGAIRELLTAGRNIEDKAHSIEYAKYGILTPALDGRWYCGREQLTREEKILSEAMIEMLQDDKIYQKYCNVMKAKMKFFDSGFICSQWEKLFYEQR